MKKNEQDTSKEVNQHKRLAMGEHVTGMKTGGVAKKKACGGMMKAGGEAKKKKK